MFLEHGSEVAGSRDLMNTVSSTRGPCLLTVGKDGRRIDLVNALEDYHDLPAVYEHLSSVIHQVNDRIKTLNAVKNERALRELELASQNSAYEESLAIDRANDEAAAAAAKEAEAAAVAATADAAMAASAAAKIESARKAAASRVPPEPAPGFAGLVTTIMFQLPTNTRIKRNFASCESRISDLVNFITGHGFGPETHVLMTRGPPMCNLTDAPDQTLAECELEKRVLLIVRERLDSEVA